jgi:hypothetical protein
MYLKRWAEKTKEYLPRTAGIFASQIAPAEGDE